MLAVVSARNPPETKSQLRMVHLSTATLVRIPRSAGRLLGSFAQTMFQFLDQLREPCRGHGVECCPNQSAALFKLPFELLSVTLLIHDGTLPL